MSGISSVGVGPLFLSTTLPDALGPACVEELVDASPKENLEDDLSSKESADASSEELVEALLEEELEWIGKTLALGFGGLEAE